MTERRIASPLDDDSRWGGFLETVEDLSERQKNLDTGLTEIKEMQIATREICNRALNVLAGRVLDAEAQYKNLLTTFGQLIVQIEQLRTEVQRCHLLFRRIVIGLCIVLGIVVLVLLGIYVF